MKKNLLVIFVALTVFSAIVMAEPKTATISTIDQVLEIDGVIDALWLEVEPTGILDDIDIPPPVDQSDENFYCSWKGLWDANYLYILCEIADDMIVQENVYPDDDNNSHQDDGFDIPLDPGNADGTSGADGILLSVTYDPTGEPHLAPNKTNWMEYPGAAEDVLLACEDTETGWTLEMAIPWGGLDPEGTIAADYELGLDLRYNDDDGNNSGNREGHYRWGTDGTWNNPSLFGTVILGAELAHVDGVNSIENSTESIQVYPNPVQDFLTVSNYYGSASIFNSTGQLVMNTVNMNETIDVSDLSSGVYMLVTELGSSQFVK